MQMPFRLSAAGCAALTIALVVGGAAEAATISHVDAERRISDMERDHASFLAKFPAMAAVDDALRGDCAQRVSGHATDDAFCRCASAVTVSLWRSGVDPKMIGRLQDYLNGSGALKPADFLRFQGPELYRPLCELGG
jgi:hypothetical protein